ncbi:hypothetical protein SAMN02982929_03995 [Saccharopolyspora kobensis]|uniref:Uncharacterized protein n=1 Tax=Saccharopolyspora kobensis TaxID=146035 RepID=A0A1H6D536_9PSEU|nr:hypothetical protein [Saccharopolyspora kobensis]SEG80412.1 hypothetical protein SAMN02982929_03995 [Saccharopolyspora kobensis]SFD11790.1 hypothetical protein SAMN05216506_102590 [Saccharopolyspora kobensis]
MFWIQLSTFVLFNAFLIALIATQVPFGGLRFTTGQHAGTGDGEYTVWHLIADVEAERHRDNADSGAHARRRERSPIALGPPAQPEIGPELRFPELDTDDQPTGRHHLHW